MKLGAFGGQQRRELAHKLLRGGLKGISHRPRLTSASMSNRVGLITSCSSRESNRTSTSRFFVQFDAVGAPPHLDRDGADDLAHPTKG